MCFLRGGEHGGSPLHWFFVGVDTGVYTNFGQPDEPQTKDYLTFETLKFKHWGFKSVLFI